MQKTCTVVRWLSQVEVPIRLTQIRSSTALREAYEEIGLAPSDVHILGTLNEFITISSYRVTPVVGVIRWPFEIDTGP